MALLTSLRDVRLHVIWIRRSLEIRQVTADASGIGCGQVVIAVHVALDALYGRVRTR